MINSMPSDDEQIDPLTTQLGHLTLKEYAIEATKRVEFINFDDDTEFDLPIPDPENRLVFGETIGKGGEGVVQLAVQKSLERQVAVKRLRDDRAHKLFEVGLLREAWIGALLAHPNIVAIHDLDYDPNGRPAIVCQHIDGESWTKLLDAEIPLGPAANQSVFENHIRILLRVCDAVSFAHDRGFLHRDLKPDNVMLGKFGEVYLIDWGIAVALDRRHGKKFPLVGEIHSGTGTPCYMAPELIRDHEEKDLYVGIPTDIYLLGGALFRIICGRPPHLVGKLDETIESIRTSVFDFPSEVPPELAGICAKALSRLPRDRYQSVAEFSAALTDFLAQQQARLVLRDADDKLAQLVSAVRDETNQGDARFDLYRLFSACRFGYGSVVDVLGDEARNRIAKAAEIMVSYELDRGDPDAAEALLAEVDDVSEQVIASIAKARDLRDAHLETLKGYADVGRSHDVTIGLRTRMWLGCLGLLLMLVGPTVRLIGYRFYDTAIGAVQQIFSPLLAALAFGAVAWFSRDYLKRHRVTRAATMIFLAGSLIHIALGVSAYSAEIPLGFVRIMNCYFIALGCLIFGVLYERGMMWSALAFVAAGLATTLDPSDVLRRNGFVIAAGALFAINVAIVWGPARLAKARQRNERA